MEEALITLGRQELAALIDREEETYVTCEFCREQYIFSWEELSRLLREIH